MSTTARYTDFTRRAKTVSDAYLEDVPTHTLTLHKIMTYLLAYLLLLSYTRTFLTP